MIPRGKCTRDDAQGRAALILGTAGTARRMARIAVRQYRKDISMPPRPHVVSALIAVAVSAFATSSSAQAPAFSIGATETCLVRTYDSVGCIGISAELCIASVDAESTTDQAACFAQEYGYWNERLDAVYADLLSAAGVTDGVLPDDSQTLRQVPALRTLQEEWVAYRDAFCAFEQSTWGGITGSPVALQQCLMTLTAVQVILLEAGMEIH
jgi:uncharacterized protein YecT (DUF1311 family)